MGSTFFSFTYGTDAFCDIQQVKMTDRGSQAAIVSLVVTALAFLFVGIRLINRIFLVKRFGLDDGLILAAVCFSIGLSAMIEVQRGNGFGEHTTELTLAQYGAFQNLFCLHACLHCWLDLCERLDCISVLALLPDQNIPIHGLESDRACHYVLRNKLDLFIAGLPATESVLDCAAEWTLF